VTQDPQHEAQSPEWRAQRKLQRLTDIWQKEERRFDGDGDILASLLVRASDGRPLAVGKDPKRRRKAGVGGHKVAEEEAL
jgi:hypothetical protein